jgi:hypothetical protein
MRRIILWIVPLLITFAIGTGADSLWRDISRKESRVSTKPGAAPVEVAAPVSAPTMPVLEPAPARQMILDYDMEKVNHYGALYIMGRVPKGFRDFECIALGLSGFYQQESSNFITVYDGENGEFEPATFALVTERHLYFTTAPRSDEGFQYRFEGEFLVKDFEPLKEKNKPAVRGTLTKSRNGRPIARQTVTFRVERMGC